MTFFIAILIVMIMLIFNIMTFMMLDNPSILNDLGQRKIRVLKKINNVLATLSVLFSLAFFAFTVFFLKSYVFSIIFSGLVILFIIDKFLSRNATKQLELDFK